jgi:hypothetical protein
MRMNSPQPLPITLLTLLACSIVPDAIADVRTFQNPVFQGYRLDYCTASGQVCGERVATEWCVGQDYQYASQWGIDRQIGRMQPTIRLDDREICRGDQCDGFNAITCARQERVFSVPTLGAATRVTAFTPDRRQATVAVTQTEVQLVVPGCSQLEPGVLLCQAAPDYQHCRILFEIGHVQGCRMAIAVDGAVADLREATSGSYELSLRARASVTVNQGSRGIGKIKGETRYRASFAIPERTEAVETCLQRDRYEYHQSGPQGGSSAIYEADDCDEPVEGRFSPHKDDLLTAYDLCERRHAWGTTIEATTDLVVAGIFHFSTVTASSAAGGAAASRSVAPYLAIRAPLEVICRE